MRKKLLENNKFVIYVDDLQFILYKKRRLSGKWEDAWYFATLSGLLYSLAHWLHKTNSRKYREIMELDKTIEKTFVETNEVCNQIKKALPSAVRGSRSASRGVKV